MQASSLRCFISDPAFSKCHTWWMKPTCECNTVTQLTQPPAGLSGIQTPHMTFILAKRLALDIFKKKQSHHVVTFQIAASSKLPLLLSLPANYSGLHCETWIPYKPSSLLVILKAWAFSLIRCTTLSVYLWEIYCTFAKMEKKENKS